MRASVLTAAVLAGLFTLTTAATVADGAPPPKAPVRTHQCFTHSEISGFTAPDDHTVFLRVSVRDIYRLETMGPCPDMDWSMRLGVRDRGGGGWICTGDLAEVIVADNGIGPQTCPVRVIAKLTPDEVAALPKKSRP
jgi:hypothetical protein